MRVELGRAYAIVNWSGRKQRGRKRIGGYEPRRANLIGTLWELNMPLLESTELSAVLCDRNQMLEGYAVAGVFWQLLSRAANTPIPGVFVQESEGQLTSIDDAGMARLLKLSRSDWLRISDALLAGSGIGVLDYRQVTIDIEPEDMETYRKDPQLLLFEPLRGCANRNRELPHERTNERNERANERANERTNERTNGTKRNGLRAPEEPEGAVSDRSPGSGDHEESEEGRAGRSGQHAKIQRYRERLDDLITADQQDEFRHGFADLLEVVLKPGHANAADRRDWRRVATNLWLRANRQTGASPDALMRRQRFDSVFCKALEMAEDGEVHNPAGCLNAWLGHMGMRAMTPAKKV